MKHLTVLLFLKQIIPPKKSCQLLCTNILISNLCLHEWLKNSIKSKSTFGNAVDGMTEIFTLYINFSFSKFSFSSTDRLFDMYLY